MPGNLHRELHTSTPLNYPKPENRDLFKAILKIKDEKEAANFFRDLLTLAEIEEFSRRWQIVRMLDQRISYAQIAAKLGVSTATVTRVAYWLHHGMNGYQTILVRIANRKSNSL